MKLRNWVYLILAVILVFTVNTITFGAGSFTDTFTIGKQPASGSDVTLELGAGKVKYSPTEKKLKYANDGVNFSSIGSGGSDGGINILKNPSFEDVNGSTILKWNATGLTASPAAIVNGIEGDIKYAILTATSASQTFCSDVVSTPETMGVGGMFDFTYTASGTKFLAYVTDASNNKLTSALSLTDQTAWVKVQPSPFSYASGQKVCFESKAAGTIKINRVYLGSNKGTGEAVSGMNQVGAVHFGGDCVFGGTGYTNTSWSGVLSDVSCSIATEGTAVQIQGNPQLGAIFKNLKVGRKYKVLSKLLLYTSNGGSSSYCTYGVHVNGTPTIAGTETYLGVTGVGYRESATLDHDFVATASEAQVDIRIKSGPNMGCYIGDANISAVSYNKITLIEHGFNDTYQTPEQAEWFIDANIGGANINLGVAAQASYATISDASLDMVLNSGSSLAQISCSGAESSGLTCSGASEHVGVSFVPPYTGYFEACFDFSFYTNNSTTAGAAFQLAQTDSGSTILAEGGSRVYTQTENVASSSQKVCGQFKFSDTSKKNIKLVFEKMAAPSGPLILADRSSSLGQRDIHITVRPVLSSNSRMILTGDTAVTKGASNGSDVFAITVSSATGLACTSTPCTITGGSSNVKSVVRDSSGVYTMNFYKPVKNFGCNCNAWSPAVEAGGQCYPNAVSPTYTTTYSWNTYNQGITALSDRTSTMVCTGTF